MTTTRPTAMDVIQAVRSRLDLSALVVPLRQQTRVAPSAATASVLAVRRAMMATNSLLTAA